MYLGHIDRNGSIGSWTYRSGVKGKGRARNNSGVKIIFKEIRMEPFQHD